MQSSRAESPGVSVRALSFAQLALAGALITAVACVGEPPVLGQYAPLNCASCGGSSDCIDLRLDPANCGTCGNTCGAGLVCSGGACTASCAAPYLSCGARCADTASDPKNCGSCGVSCGDGVCGQGKCGAGACGRSRGDCDGNPNNGCETAIASDLAHCGACGAVCAPPHAQGACTSGACSIAICADDFLDCDLEMANGCEVNVAAIRSTAEIARPCVPPATCAKGASAPWASRPALPRRRSPGTR